MRSQNQPRQEREEKRRSSCFGNQKMDIAEKTGTRKLVVRKNTHLVGHKAYISPGNAPTLQLN